MASLFSILLAIPAGLLAILVLLLCVEIVAAVALPQREELVLATMGSRPRVAVLVPAHNESTGLLDTIHDIKAQLSSNDRLLVVADNCTDDTSEIAGAAGAEVTERFHFSDIGKGYALDWGVQQLKADPPEIVIIIDADCRVAKDTISRLATVCAEKGRPVQALYLMAAPDDSPVDYRVAAFAFRVKNWVRPLGLRNLNLSCQLMGTGMAFPWDAISAADLASGSAVEDLKLGLDMVQARTPTLFCPSARVDSQFPSSVRGAETQRKRWEQGHIGTIVTNVPRLAYESIATGNFRLLLLTLDAAIPPVTLLGLLICLMAVISGVATLFHLSLTAFVISVASLIAYLLVLSICWVKFGQDILPLRAILSITRYILRLYRRVFSGNLSLQWIRTDRTKDKEVGKKFDQGTENE
jgi:cellulose synthase/poly-beta-1,6-N-acetylglucosamine synthase-like glycosyltransferase